MAQVKYVSLFPLSRELLHSVNRQCSEIITPLCNTHNTLMFNGLILGLFDDKVLTLMSSSLCEPAGQQVHETRF